MIRVRLQIGEGAISDTADAYGLVYLESDTRFSAPVRAFESSEYPETPGKNIIPITVDSPFEYSINFFINASSSIDNANKKISEFNSLLYTENEEGVKTFKRVVFYNDYKKVKISGYPKPIEEAKEFWRDSKGNQADVVCVSFIIDVDKPQDCDFNLM